MDKRRQEKIRDFSSARSISSENDNRDGSGSDLDLSMIKRNIVERTGAF